MKEVFTKALETIKAIFGGGDINIDPEVKVNSKKKVNKQRSNGDATIIEGNQYNQQAISLSQINELNAYINDRVKYEVKNVGIQSARQKALESGERLKDALIDTYTANPDKIIQAFSEPSFNFTMSDAVRAVVASNSDVAEKMIADILRYRIDQGSTPDTELITSRALDIANKINPSDLMHLTRSWLLTNIIFNKPPTKEIVLAWYKNLYLRINQLYPPIDTGSRWVDNSELLNLIKIVPFSGVPRLEEHVKNALNDIFPNSTDPESDGFKAIVYVQTKLEKDPNFISLRNWYNSSIRQGFNFTSIGKVIAFVTVKDQFKFDNVTNINELLELQDKENNK